ncbi:hypothetical protein SANTM175S_04467 [Streptomyces antimycoticus]
MEADQEATLAAGEASTRLVFAPLDLDTVARIVASRPHCSSEAEQEADLFASLLMAGEPLVAERDLDHARITRNGSGGPSA